MFFFLTVVQAIVAAALVGVILMQRSEGGGLGIGGSPTGMLSARGAADFLTRTTRILAILFVGLSIVLAGLAVNVTGDQAIDTTLDRNVAPAGAPADPLAAPAATAPAPASPSNAAADPLADGAAPQR
ncbi:preprotein translocase subunit SecG [Erythrobacteraceae bacterium CFH 75059]|uniref:preprotein translocase subunit SecG n=1 Tax=Qipengyuania thermophila TaxID=2509361 RepID=UPI001021C27D|nr:preprotein translocase subunit SecG [Qipengyuania thermophila]TCD05270.1 preprotein translocase subunit SecG [Erythrobacteraceae bacterium CFH 75059]